MIYVISKATFGSYNVRDIQCNANWCSCPYSDYALIPDDLVDGILATRGYCDITLNGAGTEVTAFTARTIPAVPEECHAEDQAATIPKTASGSHIYVKDSGDAPLTGLKLYGKTTQETYSGKNLLPYPYKLSHETLHGVAFADNGDGTITANGASTEEVNFLLTPYTARLSLEPGIYVLSGCPAGGGGASYSLEVYGSALEDNTTRSDEGNGVTFTVADNSSTITVRIRICHNKTLSNLTFRPMIRKASVADGTWEPYAGGKPAPNPECPVPLESVGDSGSVAVTAAGKNLFGGKALANVLATFDYSQLNETDGTIQFVSSSASGKLIFQNFKENTRYTFILYGRNSNSDAKESNMTLRYTDGTSVPLRFSAAGSDSYCVLVSDGRKTIQSLHGEWHTATTTLYYNKCGVFEGELTEADFEPYKGKTLTIQTPNGLAAIPVWWAGNYTDENGQQWIRDEIDFIRGVRIQRVGRGTIGIVGTVELNGLVGGIFGLPNKMAGNNIGSLCDRAVFNTSYTENTYYENSANLVVMGSATDTQESLAEKFNGATILYALATPFETPLSAEEMAQYAALHTHKPNTTIFNNGGANMDVRYCTPNTAVPMNLGKTDSVLITDEHGCVTMIPIPEMRFGVEYRALEKNEGKQVYCRRMNLGAVTTGGGYFNIDSSWNLLRWDAQCKEYALPCQINSSETNGYLFTLGVGRGNIYYNVGSAFNGYTLFVTLWYVKE